MAGHSKWANIKHKKGKADAARGKVFSRIAKEITVAARNGGGDPEANITLRALVQKAKAVNMPNDNIDRAIKKGTGELEGGALEEAMYEGYTADGTGVIVYVLTDNKNRSATDIRTCFNRFGASLASQGAVSHMFQRKGQILVDAATAGEEQLMDVVLSAGAEDLKNHGDQFEVITDPSDCPAVCEALSSAGIEMAESAVTMIPDMPVQVEEPAKARKLLQFMDALEELDDVQEVYGAFDVPDAVMEQLGEEA
jgi:YebC/PmpR family DNA-binding regulatory protein